jgi:fibronectin-binding autotransporter adhesin
MPQYPNFVGLSRYKGSWSATNNIAVTSDATPLTIEGLFGEGASSTWGGAGTTSGSSGGYALSASCTSNLTGAAANFSASAGDFWKISDAAARTIDGSSRWADGDFVIYTSGSEWIRLYSGDVQSSIVIGNMSSGSLSNTLLTASSGQGILFHYYNDATSSFSGSHQFTFNPAGPNVELTGNLIMTGNLFVEGVIKGNQFTVTTVVENVSNIHVSGATKFGNTTDDLHQYTGSLDITGAYGAGTGEPVITVKGDGVYGQQLYDVQQFQGPIQVTATGRDNYIHLSSDEAADANNAYIWTKDTVGLTLGSSLTQADLVVDAKGGATAGFIGIGTTSPAAHLHVTGTISGSATYITGPANVSGSVTSAQTITATNTIKSTDGDFTGNIKVSGSATVLNMSASNLVLASGMTLSGTVTFASSSGFNLTGASISAHRAELGQLVLSGNVSEGIVLGTTSSIHLAATQKIVLDARNTGSFLSSLYHSDYRIIELQNRGASVLKSWEYGASGRFVDYNADKYDQLYQWYGISTGSNADARFDPAGVKSNESAGAVDAPVWAFARNQIGGVSIGSADAPKTRLWVSGNLSASSGLYTGDITATGTIAGGVISGSSGYLASTLSVSGTITAGSTIRAVNTLTGTDGYLTGDADISGTLKAATITGGGTIAATNTLIGKDGYFTANVDVSGTLTATDMSASSISVSQGSINASGSIYSGLNLAAINTVTGSDSYYTGKLNVSGNVKLGAADSNVVIISQLTGNVGMSGTLGQFATLQVGGANIGSGSTPWQHDGGAIFYTNGNVGASTDDPQNPLHVSGTAFFSGSLLGGQDPIKIAGLRTGSFAGEGSYLGVDSDGKVVLNHLAHATASGGTITALNNQAVNRLVTIGSTTTELDGEANASFDGSTLNITGTFRANTIAGVSHLTASNITASYINVPPGGYLTAGTLSGSNLQIGNGSAFITGTLTVGGTLSGSAVTCDAVTSTGYSTFTGINSGQLSGTAVQINQGGLTISEVAVTATGTELNLIDGVTATTAEINYVDVSAGVGTANKALVLTAGKTIGGITALSGTTLSGSTVQAASSSFDYININGTAITSTAYEINFTDVNPGAGTASKALVLTADKEIGGITAISGTTAVFTTLSGTNLQISNGNAWISGTLTVGGGLNLDSFSDDITFASVSNIFSYNLWKASSGAGMTVQNTGGTLTLSGSTGINLSVANGQKIVVNEDSQDVDVRIESDAETHMFFVDGGANATLIGHTVEGLAPSGTLEITNHASAGAYNVPLLQLNSNDTDQIALDINAANIDADVIDIVADAVTTAIVIDITADGLTSGKALNITSDSSNTTAREVAYISNDNSSSEASTLRLYNRTTFPALVCQGRITTGLGSASSNNASGQTITAAQLIHGAWAAAGRGAGTDDTTHTAAQIVAAIPNCAVGDSFEFIFLNVSGNAVDLVGGTGVLNIAAGASSFAIAAGKGRKFRFRVTGIAGGSEAVQVWAETDDFTHSA